MPDISLTATELDAFVSIVEAETRSAGRRMLDLWARSADAQHPMLDATFRLLWRD